jgi:hypothetical protein
LMIQQEGNFHVNLELNAKSNYFVASTVTTLEFENVITLKQRNLLHN